MTPHACALVCGAYIENGLGDLLTEAFHENESASFLLKEKGLESASSRAYACHALGLIEKEVRESALAIGRIRNKFAHSHCPLDFSNNEVIQHCKNLKEPLATAPASVTEEQKKQFFADPRRRLVAVTYATFFTIMSASKTVIKQTVPTLPSACWLDASPTLISPRIIE